MENQRLAAVEAEGSQSRKLWFHLAAGIGCVRKFLVEADSAFAYTQTPQRRQGGIADDAMIQVIANAQGQMPTTLPEVTFGGVRGNRRLDLRTHHFISRGWLGGGDGLDRLAA